MLLPQAVGLRRAREMSATGNFIDAETALAWGLVNHVVPHDELLPFAPAWPPTSSSNDQAAVRQIYATYDEGGEVTAGEAWAVEHRVAGEWQGDAASIRPRSSGAERRSWNAGAPRSEPTAARERPSSSDRSAGLGRG